MLGAPFSRCYWCIGSLLDIVVHILVVVVVIVVVVVVADSLCTVVRNNQKSHKRFENFFTG